MSGYMHVQRFALPPIMGGGLPTDDVYAPDGIGDFPAHNRGGVRSRGTCAEFGNFVVVATRWKKATAFRKASQGVLMVRVYVAAVILGVELEEMAK
jgi:hypothetical protein